VTKNLSFEGFCKLLEKDPSLMLRMTRILQRALSAILERQDCLLPERFRLPWPRLRRRDWEALVL